MSKTRRCSRCRTEQPLEKFVRNRAEVSGHGYYCKPCHNLVTRINRERRYGSARNFQLMRRYGVDVDQVAKLVDDQNGVCAICRKRPAKHVDHDHRSGRIRGVLCFRCNGALGQFEDNIDWLQRAAEYLARFRDGVSEQEETYLFRSSKRCRDCGSVKPLDDFPRHRRSRDGRHTYCKPCHNARGRETRARLYGGSRHYHLRRKYGIGAGEADALIASQDGMCAICTWRPAKHIDHDHRTGLVRAALCSGCNSGLGQFGDDIEVVRSAIDYLRQRAVDETGTVHEPATSYILSVA